MEKNENAGVLLAEGNLTDDNVEKIKKVAEVLECSFDEALNDMLDTVNPNYWKPKKTSRSKRFGVAISEIEDAKLEIEQLKEELEQWLEGIPENLQGGSKAESLEEAINNLDEIILHIDDATSIDVEFPGMFG